MARKGDSRRLAFLLGPTTLFLGVFFLGPVAVMVIYSFLEPGLYGGVEWSFYHLNYGRILGWADGEWEDFDLVYAEIFFRSVRLALTNVVITLFICYPAAIWVNGLSVRWRTFVVFMITLPFFVSLVVRLFCWVLILRPSGFLNSALLGLGLISEPIDIIFTETAVLIGMAYIFLPFMFLPIYASIEKLDHSLIEASSDLADILVSPLECKSGGSRNHTQAIDLIQRVDDLLRYAIAEKLLIAIGAHIGKRKNANRRGLGIRRVRRAISEIPPYDL
jgi:ABC-type spermidine/putrescine transport system permease subunit I